MRIILLSLGFALVLFTPLIENSVDTQVQQLTPTPDRLAEPTLPGTPSQADIGAQVYWLTCMTCHGDRGQGLTDEFIQTYPPDHRNCWKSGCHGKNPYTNGFTLPDKIPAVIGKQALQKFPNASILQAYISAAMPLWNRGSLTSDQSWQVTAFLLRENGMWDSRKELSPSNAEQIRISTLQPSPITESEPVTGFAGIPVPFLIGSILLIVLSLIILLLKRSRFP